MSESTSEKTFSTYNSEQSKVYAQERLAYQSNFYKVITDFHTSSGGLLDTILDVGCGPGTAARDLAGNFVHAIGIDPSSGMLDTAHSLGGVTSSSEPIRFEKSTAEEIGSGLVPPIPNASIDLITAAAAAHWFDMSRFWPRASQVLKPGGTVAIWTWTADRFHVHPSVPNHETIQEILDTVWKVSLKDFMKPGNIINNDLYINLPMPWTLDPKVPEFEESKFVRKEWGPFESADAEGTSHMFGTLTVTLDKVEMMLGTTSSVARWREAYPDAVGTEQDVLRKMRRDVEKILRKAGVEKGMEELTLGMGTALLMVKKST